VQFNAYSVLLAERRCGASERLWAIAERLARRGLTIIPAPDRMSHAKLTDHAYRTGQADAGPADLPCGMGLQATIAAGADIGAALLDWDVFESAREFHEVLDDLGAAGDRPPVVLLSEDPDEHSVPAAAARRADGFFWLRADSPSYVASQVEQLVSQYTQQLLARFLGELAGAGDAARCLTPPGLTRSAEG
jgi:hypothetical protein